MLQDIEGAFYGARSFIQLFREGPIDILASHFGQFKVGLTDIDFNIHMNNSKYLKYMDFGRMEFLIMSQIAQRLVKNRYDLVVANIDMSYIHSLKTWQNFQIETRVLSWDFKYIYFQQIFSSHGKVYTIGLVRSAVLKEGKAVPIEVVFKLLGITHIPPEIPDTVKNWHHLIQVNRPKSLIRLSSHTGSGNKL